MAPKSPIFELVELILGNHQIAVVTQTFGEPCAGQTRCTVRTLMPGGDRVCRALQYAR